MRVLVTGANGFIGNALLQQLVARGDVEAVAGLRRAGAFVNDQLSCEQRVFGDLAATSSNADSFRGIDVVVHTAARVHVMREAVTDPLAAFRAVNVDGTLHLAAAAAKAGVKRFVFISSVKVNGEETFPDRAFTAADKPCPLDAYGLSKWETEQALQVFCEQAGMEWVIVRPPLVYGPGVRANFQRLMGGLARGVPLPLGGLDNKRSLVALDNLVDLLVICLAHPAAANQIFMVSDGDDISVAELARRLAVVLQRPARLLPVPRYWLRTSLELLGRGPDAQRLCSELCVDIAKNQSLLGWRPPHSVEDALRKTAAHFMADSSR